MFATTPPFRHPIRPASTLPGTPPNCSKHSAGSANVVSARSSVANRTNRNRHQASTAQNTCNPPRLPQSITNAHPATTPPARPVILPTPPTPSAPRPAGGSSAPTRHTPRHEPRQTTAEPRSDPADLSTPAATPSKLPTRGTRAATSLVPLDHPLTVFAAVPLIAAAPRKAPTSR
jgi:hypothetical protein